MVQWFICQNDEVTGPLTTDQVKSDVVDGKISSQALIWSRLLDHWTKISQWQNELPQLLKRSEQSRDGRLWHYAVNGTSYGPFSRPMLIKELNQLPQKAEALIWTKGMPAWAPVFDFPDLLDEIGVSRRQHPRAHIKGSVVVKTKDQAHLGKLSMISVGGCGILGVNGLKPGDKIHLDIKSPEFSESIRAKGEVRYITEGGFVGIKFDQINNESQALIIDYVRSSSSLIAA